MAVFLYNLAIGSYRLILRLIAPFHEKAAKMIAGRKHWDLKLKQDMDRSSEPVIWFHCASLGEFEQGRSLIEDFKSVYPNYRILLTFYSSSGYEVRRNYSGADAVHYLPWDTAAAASKFYSLVNPVAAIFIKYEFWYHFIDQGRRREIPILMVSTIFREQQIFFKPWGGLFREMLKNIKHLFVQDQKSLELLEGIGIKSVTIAGDTRLDRVNKITEEVVSNPVVEQFIAGGQAFIVGSSWPKDIEVLAPLINREIDLKFIIAPHEISQAHISHLASLINRPMAYYTKWNDSSQAQILVIDTVGILSHLYRYGKFAFIGGAFGKGLHNILEAATFGLPIFFGNLNYSKFAEAKALVNSGGAFSVADSDELCRTFSKLVNNPASYQEASEVCRQYVKQHTGATKLIMGYIKELLSGPSRYSN